MWLQVGEVEYSKKECYLKAIDCDEEYANAWINLGTVGGGKVQCKGCGRGYRSLDTHPAPGYRRGDGALPILVRAHASHSPFAVCVCVWHDARQFLPGCPRTYYT